MPGSGVSYVTWIMPLGTLVQFVLPRWLILPVLRFAGRIAFRFNRRQRERALANLRHVLGPDTATADLQRIARRQLEHIVIGYLDLLRGPVLRRQMTKLVEHDRAGLAALLGPPRHGVLITGHCGNWDLAGAFLAACGCRLSAVVEEIPRGWTRTFNRYRSVTGMETIPLSRLKAMSNAIKRGRWLTLVSDRDFTGAGLPCPSFDGTRPFPKGPAAFSLRHDKPIAYIHLLFQDRPGRPPYRFLCGELPRFPATGDRRRDVEEYTRQVAAHLDEIVARYPEQWLAFDAGWQ